MLTLINPLPDEWTPIAARRRCKSEWTVLPNAPCNLKQAQELRSSGLLLQALRYDDKVVEVVVRHRDGH